MSRKLIGVVTAIAAAGLLVGVASASGDDDSLTVSNASSPRSDVSSPATEGTGSGSPTHVTIVDRSATSTSVESTTSTSRDEGSSSSTNATFDDRSTLPVTTEARTYDVHGAGSVTVQLVTGALVLVDAEAAIGWTIEVGESDSSDIRVEFENGDSDARFEARIRDGEVRVEIRRD